MSRIAKWKLEKVKVKVVFRLQFHATHIPQTGWDKLFISFIPADSGKVTAKTSKSNVRNGTCKWADPIYETTRLLQDIKTKQYDGKLYKLVVAMGSSRSSLLGEANINLADYADASKPSTVALPLHECNYGTVLHVTVQLLTSKTGFREFEQQRELRERGLHMATNSHDEPVEQFSTSSDMRNDQIDKANTRVRFKSEARDLPSLEEEVELNEDYADSAAGIDDSSNTSESIYAEKHDSSTHEIDSLKSTISGDLGGHSLSQSPTEKGDPSDHQLLTQRSSDWVHGWSSDYSMDNELVTASEENSRLRTSLELAESSIIELKVEVSSLQSHADELGAETQKFSQLLAAEIASGEELAKEINILKSECSKFKDDFEHLKHSKINSSIERESVQRNQLPLLQGLQIKWLQGLLILEDKLREVQKKMCLQYHNRDIDFVNPDFEALQLLLHDLKQGTTQTMSLLNVQLGEQAIVSETAVIIAQKHEQFVSGNRFEGIDADQYYYEDIVHGLRRHGHVTQDHEPTVATIALEEKISELQQELEESKTERDSLTRKMDQMECYYEALIQELEENQKHMLGELQSLRNEHSTCLYAISSCKSQMEKAHEDMNEQLMRFSEERHQLDSLNKELERRAIASETALERARWNYSIAVDQLQKDLQLLSFQVLSMFETSENLVRKAFVDSSESCFQEDLEENSEAINSCLHKEYPSLLQKQCSTKPQENKVKFFESQKIERALASDKVVSFPNFMAHREIGDVHSNLVVGAGRDFDVSDSLICQKSNIDCTNSKYNLHSADSDTRHLECQHHNAERKDQFSGGEILLGDLRGSLHLQEELYQKFEHELYEVHAANVHLDVFSMALQEALHEASGGIKQMKQEIDQLSQQLAQSVESNEFLTVRLQVALDDLNTLKDSEAHCVAKCNELALQNQVLEEKFQSVFHENCFLNQKVQEYEPLVLEYKNIESMYEACTAEKIELLNLLKQETFEKCSLQNVVSLVNEDLNSLKEDFNKQSIIKNKLENTVLAVRDKLGALWSTVIALNEKIDEPSLCFPLQQEMEEKNFISSLSHLEELLQKAYEKILQLTQGVKDVEEQRGVAQQSLISKESEILFMKKKYESNIHNMAAKIDTSNALVEKLQLELENITSKLMISHEGEERYAEESKEISSRLAVLEVELQNATSDNKDLAQKILDLEGVNEELERTKQTAFSSRQEKQELMMSLQAGNEESAHLEKELCGIKEALQSTRDELHSEISLRFELEGVVTDLSCQLNVKNDLILSFDKEKAELAHLKQLVLDLELEKNKMCDLLLDSEECLRKANENTSSLHAEVTDLQTHLVMLYEYVIAADIELICTKNQLQSRMQELVQQLESLDRCYRELHLKHLDVLTTLNGRISSEAQYVEEKARLLAVLDSLKSEMEATVTEKNNLVNRNNYFLAELELYKTKAEISDVQNKHPNELERDKLKHMLLSCEEAIDNLRSSRDEHEITVIVLRAKLDEQLNQILLLEEYANDLTMLRNHNNELARRLSEQTLKSEEFKNLSAHLKELKDKADAECLLAREKRETEAPPTAVQQESLRIAFIREQCETKLQELRNQLFISKKHGEEMLLKLQDALDEVENRKRSEASHKRKNEELSLKILDLESELQMVLADKREKVKACDELKAELECSLISLDCCKEEKQKLEVSLRECIEERAKASIELSVIKEQLESSRSPTDVRVEGNLKPCTPELISINNLALEDVSCEEQVGRLVPMQDSLTSKTVVEISSQAVMDQEDLRQLALINKNFTVQSLKTSMGHLHEELEKMKNENLASLPQDANYFDPVFQGLQREVLRLNKANEQLSSIFPSFNEFSCSGNALERVLALEIELAEALQAKKKSNFHFQSSFLKQHNDEEAVFQSFRDINELIKDMLELKGRYVAVETELKEMHDRYSQLSLQFAEVEGERQKLVMTLKNSRTPKKISSLHRSTSATLEDPS